MKYQKKPVNIKRYEMYQVDIDCICRVLTEDRKSYKGCIWKYKQ